MGEQKEKTKGNDANAGFAREYCEKVENELDSICGTILELLNGNLLEKASTDESKVFYHKMKADYYRYIAEFKTDDTKKAAAENARKAYDDASNIASAGLPVTHPIRLGLALNFSVFQYRCLATLKRLARWHAPHLRMPLLSSTTWLRIPTRIPHSSC